MRARICRGAIAQRYATVWRSSRTAAQHSAARGYSARTGFVAETSARRYSEGIGDEREAEGRAAQATTSSR